MTPPPADHWNNGGAGDDGHDGADGGGDGHNDDGDGDGATVILLQMRDTRWT